MPHTISQPLIFEPWQLVVAALISVAGFGILTWQTIQIRDTCRWWQPLAIWIVPGLLAVLQWVTASHASTIRFVWTPLILMISLIWGVIVSTRVTNRVNAWWPVKALSRLLMIAGGFAVVAIVLSPAVMQARNAAWRTSHKCSFLQIGLASHNYHDTYQSLPIPAVGDPPHSWRVSVLPFMDESRLYQQYQFDASWDSDENLPISRQPQRTCHRRNDDGWHDSLGRYFCYFAMITGPNTLWEHNRPMAMRDIADGTSNTILAGEALGWKIVWTEPRDIDVREATWDINRPGPLPDVSNSLVSSFLEGGAYVLFADGTVRFLSNKIDPNTLKALVSPNGHERIGDF